MNSGCTKPFITVCVATYHKRRKYHENILSNFDRQNYDRNKLHMVVCDDDPINGDRSTVFDGRPDVTYVFRRDKWILGNKRNHAISISPADTEIIAIFDDDDFYGSDYLGTVVKAYEDPEILLTKLDSWTSVTMGKNRDRVTFVDVAPFHNKIGWGWTLTFRKRIIEDAKHEIISRANDWIPNSDFDAYLDRYLELHPEIRYGELNSAEEDCLMRNFLRKYSEGNILRFNIASSATPPSVTEDEIEKMGLSRIASQNFPAGMVLKFDYVEKHYCSGGLAWDLLYVFQENGRDKEHSEREMRLMFKDGWPVIEKLFLNKYIEDHVKRTTTRRPFVTICVATFHKRKDFHENILANFERQNYDRNKLHMVICDDDPSGTKTSLFDNRPDITYEFRTNKWVLGDKRNRAVEISPPETEIIAIFDDDDFYGPEYINTIVKAYGDPYILLTRIDSWTCVTTGKNRDRIAYVDVAPTHNKIGWGWGITFRKTIFERSGAKEIHDFWTTDELVHEYTQRHPEIRYGNFNHSEEDCLMLNFLKKHTEKRIFRFNVQSVAKPQHPTAEEMERKWLIIPRNPNLPLGMVLKFDLRKDFPCMDWSDYYVFQRDGKDHEYSELEMMELFGREQWEIIDRLYISKCMK